MRIKHNLNNYINISDQTVKFTGKSVIPICKKGKNGYRATTALINEIEEDEDIQQTMLYCVILDLNGILAVTKSEFNYLLKQQILPDYYLYYDDIALEKFNDGSWHPCFDESKNIENAKETKKIISEIPAEYR